jgi:hypothetical protein
VQWWRPPLRGKVHGTLDGCLYDMHAFSIRDYRGCFIERVRLRGPDLPRMGEDLMVAIETVQAFGSVAWSDHGECGIAFDQPLPLETEELLQGKVRLGRGLPLDIQAVFDNWVLGSGR